MSDKDCSLVITGTSSLAEGDLSLALGEQIGQWSTLKFGAAIINFIRSSLKKAISKCCVHDKAESIPAGAQNRLRTIKYAQ